MKHITSRPLSGRLFVWGSLLGLASLSACSSTPLLRTAGDTLQLFREAPSEYPRSRAEIDALPYAQLGVKFGSAPPAIFVLAQLREDRLYWVSANNLLIVTRHGRIVETRGFPLDVKILDASGGDWLGRYEPGVPPGPAVPLQLRVPAVPELSGPLELNLRPRETETFDILGLQVEALRVEERVRSPHLEWSAINVYWLSQRSRLVWRSVQHPGPDFPPVRLELLKRPG